jgi:hypothetical protein
MCAGRTGQLQHEIVAASNLKGRGLIIEPRAAVAAGIIAIGQASPCILSNENSHFNDINDLADATTACWFRSQDFSVSSQCVLAPV